MNRDEDRQLDIRQAPKPWEPLGGVVPGLKFGNSRSKGKAAALKRVRQRRKRRKLYGKS